jgi:tetratricopeptide (TPR) repeat protein
MIARQPRSPERGGRRAKVAGLVLAGMFLTGGSMPAFPQAIGALADAERCKTERDPDVAAPYCDRALKNRDQLPLDMLIALLDIRGDYYLSKKQHERAIADFTAAIEANPKGPLASILLNTRCVVYTNLGRLAAALADCNDSLRLNPNAPFPLQNRGFIYLRTGKFDLTIADYDAALRANPKLDAALYGRGVAKLRKGDIAGSNADIAAAKAIDPNIAQSFPDH